MSRTRNAAVWSAFIYTQYALAVVSGFVLFPLVIWYLGAYDNGLWLVSGELVGYLLLGDLGVFTVLPWLVATKDGAGDHPAIARYLADALAVGAAVGFGCAAVAAVVWWGDPGRFGVSPADWAKIRGPLTLLLVLTGIGFPFRAFLALLTGLQDVTVGGAISLTQAALTVALTAILVPLGYGLLGLAVAAGVPPLLAGLTAGVRVFTRHRAVTRGWHRPAWSGCRFLVRQGFGAWLGGMGVRLLTASNGLVLAALGRPDWATVYAATGKVAQVAQPLCWVLPDSGLVGLSQVHGEGDPNRTRRVVLCLLLLYLLIPGFVAVGLLAANGWFLRVWLGSHLYAGGYVSGLIAANLVVGCASGGVFKLVAVAGYRTPIGITAVVGGALCVGLGYSLAATRGLAGLAEASLITSLVFSPVGLYLLARVHGVRPREFLASCVGPWCIRALPVLALAAWIGGRLDTASVAVVGPVTALLCGAYLVAIRPLIDQAPWPVGVRVWLSRPSGPSRFRSGRGPSGPDLDPLSPSCHSTQPASD